MKQVFLLSLLGLGAVAWAAEPGSPLVSDSFEKPAVEIQKPLLIRADPQGKIEGDNPGLQWELEPQAVVGIERLPWGDPPAKPPAATDGQQVFVLLSPNAGLRKTVGKVEAGVTYTLEFDIYGSSAYAGNDVALVAGPAGLLAYSSDFNGWANGFVEGNSIDGIKQNDTAATNVAGLEQGKWSRFRLTAGPLPDGHTIAQADGSRIASIGQDLIVIVRRGGPQAGGGNVFIDNLRLTRSPAGSN